MAQGVALIAASALAVTNKADLTRGHVGPRPMKRAAWARHAAGVDGMPPSIEARGQGVQALLQQSGAVSKNFGCATGIRPPWQGPAPAGG